MLVSTGNRIEGSARGPSGRVCRTPTRSDHEVRLSRHHPPTHHPRHLAQRLKAAVSDSPKPSNPYIF